MKYRWISRAIIGLSSMLALTGFGFLVVHDPSTGIVFRARIGDRVERGDEIGEVHARDDDAAVAAANRVNAALTFLDHDVDPPPLVYAWTYAGDPGETA